MRSIEEYLIKHNGSVSPSIKESVLQADYSIDLNERVRYALPATFSCNGKSHAGVIAVTTHQLLCCSSVQRNLVRISMPFPIASA